MNLALGLQAVDEYFREGDRRKTREYQQALRDSELSMLPDKMESERSGYRDRTAENDARAQIRPGQVRNTVEENRQKGVGLEGAGRRQPTVEKKKDLDANYSLAESEFNAAQQPGLQETAANSNALKQRTVAFDLSQAPEKEKIATNKTKVEAALAEQAANPNTLAEMIDVQAGKGLIARDQATVSVLSALAQKVESGDTNGALAFANAVARRSNLLPGTNGMNFVSMTPVANGKDDAGNTGPGRTLQTDDGRKIFIADATLRNAYRATQGKPEYDFMTTRNGTIAVGDKRSGRLRILHQGKESDGTASSGAATGKLPADIQKLQYMVKNGIAANEKEAWAMMQTAKQKSRGTFIQDYVLRNTGMGQDSTKLGEQAAKIYDDLRRMEGGPYAGSNPAAPSNSAATRKVSPETQERINSLIFSK